MLQRAINRQLQVVAKKYSPKKGVFKPKNPEKYNGNPTQIVFRSGWEQQFMSYLDNHPDVLSWSSETIIIRYRCPVTGRVRRYFPDFKVRYKNRQGLIEDVIYEIKPARETAPPKRMSKYYVKHVNTFKVNKAKWEAAVDYCKRRNLKFKILTEHELFGGKK